MLSQDEKQRSTSVTSKTLEETFLSDRRAEVKVVKGQRQYVLSFKGTSHCQLLVKFQIKIGSPQVKTESRQEGLAAKVQNKFQVKTCKSCNKYQAMSQVENLLNSP